MGKHLFQAGERNLNWKGGRTVTEHGYVLIKMPSHPGADVRGYVYEHRLVAEKKLGRYLRDGEIPHHKNEIRHDNRPENIEVCATQWEHLSLHRKSERGLRNPGEGNPLVACECGCGKAFAKFDSMGRPRRFVSGHKPHLATTLDAITSVLMAGPAQRAQLAEKIGIGIRAVAVGLSKLRRSGKVERVAPGIWSLKSLQVREWPT